MILQLNGNPKETTSAYQLDLHLLLPKLLQILTPPVKITVFFSEFKIFFWNVGAASTQY